jgi:hypothetical protein
MMESDNLYVNIIELPEAWIKLRNDNIVHVIFKTGAVLDVPLQMRMLDKYIEICDGRKLPFLFDAMEHVTITKEAKVNAVEIERLAPVTANAVIARNLAYRLIAEFYLKVNKPKMPFKIFKNEDDAISWLRLFLY